jgi:hypothetical protein
MGDSRAATRDGVQRDIGTLWTLMRGESKARCAILALPEGVELRVVMDGSTLRAERCERFEQAFALAERWRSRMMDRGWVRLVPGAAPSLN